MASLRPEMMLTGTMINFAVDLLQKPEGYELMNVDESNKFLIEPEEFREMFEVIFITNTFCSMLQWILNVTKKMFIFDSHLDIKLRK